MKAIHGITPKSVEELSSFVKKLLSDGGQLGNWDLSGLPETFEHEAEDLTVTVSSGMKLGELQGRLGKKGQWLPIDPAVGSDLSLETVLSWNHYGSKRVGYGMVRDYVLGLEVVLGDGSIVHSGGRVVKNVAGFDLAKLFIGSRGTLGIVTGMTLKLHPLAQTSCAVAWSTRKEEELRGVLARIKEKSLLPVAWDLEGSGQPREWKVWLEFSGAEESVHFQVEALKGIGFEGVNDSEVQEWRGRQRELARNWPPVSIRPDRGLDWMTGGESEGAWLMVPCGCLFPKGVMAKVRGGVGPGVLRLEERVKEKLDPGGVFPSLAQIQRGVGLIS